jgi:hypothetical protein
MGNNTANFSDLLYGNNHIYALRTSTVADIGRTNSKNGDSTQASFIGHRYRIQYKPNGDITVLGKINESNSILLLQCFQTKIIKLINDN